MTPSELTSRVTAECALGVGALAIVSAWMAGLHGALGALAGGAIALLNFRWIARACSAAGQADALGGLALSGLATGARYLASFAALAGVLVSGWIHPVALMAGLAAVPVSIIARGLLGSRHEPEPTPRS